MEFVRLYKEVIFCEILTYHVFGLLILSMIYCDVLAAPYLESILEGEVLKSLGCGLFIFSLFISFDSSIVPIGNHPLVVQQLLTGVIVLSRYRINFRWKMP